MIPHDIQAALSSAPEIDLDADPTLDQIHEAFPELASFDKGGVTVGRFSGRTPWERHLDSDEFLHVLDGEVEITLLRDADSVHVTVSAGSIFVVPGPLAPSGAAPGRNRPLSYPDRPWACFVRRRSSDRSIGGTERHAA